VLQREQGPRGENGKANATKVQYKGPRRRIWGPLGIARRGPERMIAHEKGWSPSDCLDPGLTLPLMI
jgi:hypothetical protein